jgi:hypothetical protein
VQFHPARPASQRSHLRPLNPVLHSQRPATQLPRLLPEQSSEVEQAGRCEEPDSLPLLESSAVAARASKSCMSTTSRAVRGSLGILQIRRLENADDTGIYALVRRFCQTVITSCLFSGTTRVPRGTRCQGRRTQRPRATAAMPRCTIVLQGGAAEATRVRSMQDATYVPRTAGTHSIHKTGRRGKKGCHRLLKRTHKHECD